MISQVWHMTLVLNLKVKVPYLHVEGFDTYPRGTFETTFDVTVWLLCDILGKSTYHFFLTSRALQLWVQLSRITWHAINDNRLAFKL